LSPEGIIEAKTAVLEFVKAQYESLQSVPSIGSIVKKLKLSRVRLYKLFPGGLAQICREAGVPVPTERSRAVEAALAARRDRIGGRCLGTDGGAADSDLEKIIFSRLNIGYGPEEIVAEMGRMDVVDRCFQKWRSWRMDDYMKGQAKLRQLARDLDLHDVEHSFLDGISKLGKMLKEANLEKESMNKRMERLQDACTYYRQRFDGARFVYMHFVRNTVRIIVEFHARLRSSRSDDETIEAVCSLVNQLHVEVEALQGPLGINPDDPLLQLIGEYAEIVVHAIALYKVKALEQSILR